MSSEFISTREIPALFNKGPRWLERNLAKLKERGFPEPVSRGTYLRAAVLEFRDRYGRARNDEEDKRTLVVSGLDFGNMTKARDVRALIDRTLAHGKGRHPR